MEMSDIYKLMSSPFAKRPSFREPDLPAKMIDLGIKEPIRDKLSL
jgi:hypothetical protein